MLVAGLAQETEQLDEVVHQRHRLMILALLDAADAAVGVAHLRQLLELTPGNLHRHLGVLAGAGYVEVYEDPGRGRQRMIVRATTAGREAYRAELATLERMRREAERAALGTFAK